MLRTATVTQPDSSRRGASTSAFLSLIHIVPMSSTGSRVFTGNASLVNTVLALHLSALGES